MLQNMIIQKKYYNECIKGMTENVHSKDVFQLLNEYAHEFICVIFDNNALLY